jgi:antitoxin component of RelBE/YafQ-DinJ toxin-antitoxin module
MDYKTKVAQTRLSPSIVKDINKKLETTGLTMSDYLRLLVLKDLDRLPIEIPDNLPTIELTKDQEKKLDKSMKDVKAGRVTEVWDIEEYFDNLLTNGK